MRVGSLFSGIGGIDLGLERAGFTIQWQCEKDEWCRKILTKHWPEVPKYEDVQTLDASAVEPVGLLAGGFPCTNISQCGKRAGITGAHSRLWKDMVRAICVVRPSYVLVENVAALRIRGMDVVLSDLASIGYDAEWDSVPASAVGAPMRRDRLYLVAQPECERRERCIPETIQRVSAFSWNQNVRGVEDLRRRPGIPEPLLRRTGNGVPRGMDRLRGLGNAVVPQIVEWIGARILAHARSEAQ